MGVDLQTKTFRVRGITCMDCITHIARNVRRVPGTQKVSGNLDQSTVKIAFEAGKTSLEEIVRAIEDAGYAVESVEV